MSHWWDLCEDLRDDDDKECPKRHDRRDHGCPDHHDGHDKHLDGHGCAKKPRRRHRCDCKRKRRSPFIPIGTVTIDCTPVVFRTNQCPCPHW